MSQGTAEAFSYRWEELHSEKSNVRRHPLISLEIRQSCKVTCCLRPYLGCISCGCTACLSSALQLPVCALSSSRTGVTPVFPPFIPLYPTLPCLHAGKLQPEREKWDILASPAILGWGDNQDTHTQKQELNGCATVSLCKSINIIYFTQFLNFCEHQCLMFNRITWNS